MKKFRKLGLNVLPSLLFLETLDSFMVSGMEKRQDCTRNVNLIDLYPTLIDLCGLPEKKLDGKSIKPLLQNPTLQWTPTLTTYGEGNHSVMSEKWHYITRRNGVEELYDLEDDPMEWTNLMQTHPEEFHAVIAKLRPFLPQSDAKEIPKSAKDKSVKTIDETIKPRRDLSKLR